MSADELLSQEDVFAPFHRKPEYRKKLRKLRPYHALVKAIIQRRTDLGLTQKDLAAKANTYQSRVSKIETAEHDLRLSTLIEIAEALETEVVIQLQPFNASEYAENSQNYIEFLYQGCVTASPTEEVTAYSPAVSYDVKIIPARVK